MPIEIHVTERDTFKFCRRQWKYAYQENLHPAEEYKGALWIGKGTHYALAEYYKTGRDPIDGFREWLRTKVDPDEFMMLYDDQQQALEGTVVLIEEMLTGYMDFAQKHDDFKVVAVEFPIRVRIPGSPAYLVGTLDMVVQRAGKLWVVDHKTYQSFVTAEQLQKDDQMKAYLWLLWQKTGKVPAGAIYNQFRKKIPATPLLLKNGKALSKDKSIDTTAERYRRAIKGYGFEEADYTDLLAYLEGNEFFRREEVAHTKTSLANFTTQLTAEMQDMCNPKAPIYPYIKRDCSWGCSYKMLCDSDDEGGDTQSLKNFHYFVQKGRIE